MATSFILETVFLLEVEIGNENFGSSVHSTLESAINRSPCSPSLRTKYAHRTRTPDFPPQEACRN